MHASPAPKMPRIAGGELLDSHSPAKLAEIANGYWLPRCLHIATELGVADHIERPLDCGSDRCLAAQDSCNRSCGMSEPSAAIADVSSAVEQLYQMSRD
jgi:hypothetical protein